MLNVKAFGKTKAIDFSGWPTWLAVIGYGVLIVLFALFIITGVVIEIALRLAKIAAYLGVAAAFMFMVWYVSLPYYAKNKIEKVGVIKCYNLKCWKDSNEHIKR